MGGKTVSKHNDDASTQQKTDYSNLAWRKSSFSGADNCVEYAQVNDTTVAIRDSKNLDKAPLIYTNKEWAAFVESVKKGEFDI